MNGERYVGVALDYSPGSRYALKWAIDNCLRENDHLIVVVVNKDSILEGGQAALWEASGTRKIPSPLFYFLLIFILHFLASNSLPTFASPQNFLNCPHAELLWNMAMPVMA